jgi:hypothetical protein
MHTQGLKPFKVSGLQYKSQVLARPLQCCGTALGCRQCYRFMVVPLNRAVHPLDLPVRLRMVEPDEAVINGDALHAAMR